jgi:hypothetical protein
MNEDVETEMDGRYQHAYARDEEYGVMTDSVQRHARHTFGSCIRWSKCISLHPEPVCRVTVVL